MPRASPAPSLSRHSSPSEPVVDDLANHAHTAVSKVPIPAPKTGPARRGGRGSVKSGKSNLGVTPGKDMEGGAASSGSGEGIDGRRKSSRAIKLSAKALGR